jgi:hypothetical protein
MRLGTRAKQEAESEGGQSTRITTRTVIGHLPARKNYFEE